MHPTTRKIVAILAGVVVGAIIMSLIEGYSPYQPPLGASYDNGEWPYLDWVQKLPTNAWLTFLGSLLTGCFVGGFVTHKITPPAQFPVSLITGFMLLFVTIGKYMGFASPAWMSTAACIGCLVAAWLGGWLAHWNKSKA